MNRVKENYIKNIRPALIKKFNYTSVMQAPKLDKIVVNMGVGDAIQNSKALDAAVAEMTTIVGQKPVITKAKKINCCFQIT